MLKIEEVVTGNYLNTKDSNNFFINDNYEPN